MKKKLLVITLATFLLCNIFSTIALANTASNLDENIIYTEFLENGFYYETIISSESPSQINLLSSSKTITKTKTTSLKNSSGTILWSLSITATFTYDGSTSKCTSCSPKSSAPSPYWSVTNVTSSRSGNTATAKASVKYSAPSGASNTYAKSVTISCSPSGIVS